MGLVVRLSSAGFRKLLTSVSASSLASIVTIASPDEFQWLHAEQLVAYHTVRALGANHCNRTTRQFVRRHRTGGLNQRHAYCIPVGEGGVNWPLFLQNDISQN